MEAEHRAAIRELLMLMGLAAATDQWKVHPIAEGKTDVSEPAAETSLVTVAIERPSTSKLLNGGFNRPNAVSI